MKRRIKKQRNYQSEKTTKIIIVFNYNIMVIFLLGLGVLGYLPKTKMNLGLLSIAHFLHTLSLESYFYKTFYQLAKF